MVHHPLEKKLGIKFNNLSLLKTALTHRSYLNENRQGTVEHNERLEFLGDAVLEFLVTYYLYQHYPGASEGDLTNIRASVVSTKALGQLGRILELGRYLRMAKGEEGGGGRTRLSNMANCFEALLGAIFIDGGWDPANAFLHQTIYPSIQLIITKGNYRDPKSLLQEKLQSSKKISPRYETVKESGPDHRKMFIIGVYARDKLLATGKGHSKQQAEEVAASNAIKIYDKI